MRDVAGFGASFEHVLVQTRVLIPHAKGDLEPSSDGVALFRVQAFVVRSVQSEDDAQIAALRHEHGVIDEREEIDQVAHRASVGEFMDDGRHTSHDCAPRLMAIAASLPES